MISGTITFYVPGAEPEPRRYESKEDRRRLIHLYSLLRLEPYHYIISPDVALMSFSIDRIVNDLTQHFKTE